MPPPLAIYEGLTPKSGIASCMLEGAAFSKWDDDYDKVSAENMLRVLEETKQYFFGDWE